jgi:hypothetical protein
MLQFALSRFRLGVAYLSSLKASLKFRSAPSSYELLPTSSTSQETMKQGGPRPSALVLLVLLLLVIGGVSGGLVLRSSHPVGK